MRIVEPSITTALSSTLSPEGKLSSVSWGTPANHCKVIPLLSNVWHTKYSHCTLAVQCILHDCVHLLWNKYSDSHLTLVIQCISYIVSLTNDHEQYRFYIYSYLSDMEDEVIIPNCFCLVCLVDGYGVSAIFQPLNGGRVSCSGILSTITWYREASLWGLNLLPSLYVLNEVQQSFCAQHGSLNPTCNRKELQN